MKILTSFRKEQFVLTIVPTIQYYHAHRIVAFVWLNYELQLQIR
jgi:hypothetical protein